jgi:hypothetical protein
MRRIRSPFSITNVSPSITGQHLKLTPLSLGVVELRRVQPIGPTMAMKSNQAVWIGSLGAA